jgi:NADH-quinone oxidoreductase subunit M
MNAFVGEFLIISGAFKANMIIAAFSILGVVLGACYMVWLYYRVALNEINTTTQSSLVDLDLREIATLAPLVLLVLMIGLQPNILLSYMHVSVEHLVEQLHNSIILEDINAYDTVSSIAEYIKALFKWV